MTKSLTEKWKDGELPEDTYYVMFFCGRYGTYEFENLKGFGFDNDLAYIKEVLAPVPSYEELEILKDDRNYFEKTVFERNAAINHLEEQLKEANEALKSLIGGDKNTLYYLEKILPMCEHDKVLHDYLQKIINDFENDLKEIEKRGVK